MGEVVQFECKKPRHAYSGFGGCPHCGQDDGYLNVGREHWFFCREHKTKWRVGTNLFSSWREEDEGAWQRNRFTLAEYMTVDPVRPEQP